MNYFQSKISSNSIQLVIQYFKDQLGLLYAKTEIDSFIFIAFEKVLNFSKTDLILNNGKNIRDTEFLKLINIVKQLKQYKPIQYIIGETEFYNLRLKVDKRAMIPRPETEELIDWIIRGASKNDCNKRNNKLKILDIGTGNGCIAIALKKNLHNTHVFAIDISDKALALAHENAHINNVEVSFHQADILQQPHPGSPLSFGGVGWGLYDIIVSNPPYVRNSEKNQMNNNVLKYEPHLALFIDDDDPLLFYEVILNLALRKLNKNGMLYFEINEKFGTAIKQLIRKKGFSDIILKKDIRGKDRMIAAKLMSC